MTVLIIGGGTAGCAVALAVTKCNPDTTYLLLDDADPLNFKVSQSITFVELHQTHLA